MPDPTVPVRRALRHLQERTAMRLEVAMLRRELADARAENTALRLVAALAPFTGTSAPLLPPLRFTPVRIPAPRLAPEGLRDARAPRPLRRRPR